MFALFASASFLLVVVVALFFGDTVASEASWSSLRYLLAAPIPRARLLRQKAIVAALLSVAAIVLLPVVALLVGSLAYGTGNLVSPTGESLTFAAGAGRVLLGALYIAVYLSWVAGLALLLSVSTDAPLGAVGGAVMVSIVSQILDQITALEDLRDYLPTHYGTAWSGPARPDGGLVRHDPRDLLLALLRAGPRRAGRLPLPPQGHHQLTAAASGPVRRAPPCRRSR